MSRPGSPGRQADASSVLALWFAAGEHGPGRGRERTALQAIQLPASLIEDEGWELFDPVAPEGLHFEVRVHRQDGGHLATDRLQAGPQLPAGFTARRPEGCQNQP